MNSKLKTMYSILLLVLFAGDAFSQEADPQKIYDSLDIKRKIEWKVLEKHKDELSAGLLTPIVFYGKYVDPGKYDIHTMYTDSDGKNLMMPDVAFSVYVVRLGVTEIAFEGNANHEYFPLQFQAQKAIDLNDGISPPAEWYELPAANWRIGDETSNRQNADITSGANAGNRRETLAPYVNYTADKFTVFHPPLDVPGSSDIENDTWNYPVCYKQGSKMKIKITPSVGAYSQVKRKILASTELGFSSAGRPNIMMTAKIVGAAEEMIPVTSSSNISPGTEVVFVDKSPAVKTSVGCETRKIQFSWSYKEGTNDVIIPGKMETAHTVYSIVGPPNTPWNATVRPWVSALHYATEWAKDATSQNQVADKITEKINDGLGLTYDDSSGGNNYGHKTFFMLSNFTLFLIGEAKNSALISNSIPAFVNCSDCSVLATTFSNVIGGELCVSHIEQTHALNQIIAIGGTRFPYPRWDRFKYHAFTSNSTNEIWDACLKVRDGSKIDPTDPASGNDAKLPMGMPYINTKTSLATATSPALVKSTGSDANGTLSIEKVYQENNHNGVVPASCTLTCTAATATTATFTLDCERNGTLVGITLAGAPCHATLSKNGIKIIDFKIEKGTKPFCVGDTFTFELKYDFSDYRSSLAAPDWELMRFGIRGRTPAGTKNNYNITVLR